MSRVLCALVAVPALAIASYWAYVAVVLPGIHPSQAGPSTADHRVEEMFAIVAAVLLGCAGFALIRGAFGKLVRLDLIVAIYLCGMLISVAGLLFVFGSSPD